MEDQNSLANYERFCSNNGEAKKPRKSLISQTYHHGMAIQSVCLKLGVVEESISSFVSFVSTYGHDSVVILSNLKRVELKRKGGLLTLLSFFLRSGIFYLLIALLKP